MTRRSAGAPLGSRRLVSASWPSQCTAPVKAGPLTRWRARQPGLGTGAGAARRQTHMDGIERVVIASQLTYEAALACAAEEGSELVRIEVDSDNTWFVTDVVFDDGE